MTDDLSLLRDHRGDPEPPGEAVRADARRAVERAVALEGRLRAPASRRRPSRRLLVRVAVAAVLAVSAVLIVPGLLRSGPTTAPTPALAAGPALRHLARLAATRTPTTPGPGQYLYTTSRSLTESDTALPGGVYCQAVFQEYRRNWIARNGAGLFVEQDGPARYRSPSEARACDSAPVQPSGAFYTWAAPGCLGIDPVPLEHLPRDPVRLRARLLTGKVEGGPRGPAEAFVQVADLLRETDAPPALRSALFGAAAGLHGVRSLGLVTDRQGRKGIALAIATAGIRHELVLSLTTSDLLEERDVLVRPKRAIHARVGTTLDWSTYSIPRVVAALPGASPLPMSPSCVRGAGTVRKVPGHPRETVIVGAPAAGLQPVPK
jgi:hypothetical protein